MEIKTKENCSEVINKGQGEKKKSIKGGTNGGLTGASPVPLQHRLQSSSCTLNLSSLILFLNFFLKKKKDDLQCRVSVRCMPQGIRFTYTWKYIFLPFQILFPYRLIENTEYSSLWSTVSPCCSCTFMFIYLFLNLYLFGCVGSYL